MLLPMLLFTLQCPARLWGDKRFAPAAVLSLIPLLWLIDCLLNAMVNFVWIAVCGGVTGLLATYGIRRMEGEVDDEPAAGKAGKQRKIPVPQLPLPEPEKAYVTFSGTRGAGRPQGRRGIRPLRRDRRFDDLALPGVTPRVGRFLTDEPEAGVESITRPGEAPRPIAVGRRALRVGIHRPSPAGVRIFRSLGSGVMRNLTDPGKRVRMKPSEDVEQEKQGTQYLYGEEQWVRQV
jgi:hypothetical protein